eukprot:s116_g5.t3
MGGAGNWMETKCLGGFLNHVGKFAQRHFRSCCSEHRISRGLDPQTAEFLEALPSELQKQVTRGFHPPSEEKRSMDAQIRRFANSIASKLQVPLPRERSNSGTSSMATTKATETGGSTPAERDGAGTPAVLAPTPAPSPKVWNQQEEMPIWGSLAQTVSACHNSVYPALRHQSAHRCSHLSADMGGYGKASGKGAKGPKGGKGKGKGTDKWEDVAPMKGKGKGKEMKGKGKEMKGKGKGKAWDDYYEPIPKGKGKGKSYEPEPYWGPPPSKGKGKWDDEPPMKGKGKSMKGKALGKGEMMEMKGKGKGKGKSKGKYEEFDDYPPKGKGKGKAMKGKGKEKGKAKGKGKAMDDEPPLGRRIWDHYPFWASPLSPAQVPNDMCWGVNTAQVMQIWWLVASLALSRTLAENCSFSEQCEEDAQVLIQQQSVQRSAAGTGVGVAVGAHISTLDGMRYPFSSHGTFELWGIRGVPSKALGGVELDPNTKRPVSVNWQLLAHYSGNAKITGVLLQDLSNPTDSLMQLTSEDCRWSKKLISPAEGSKEEAKNGVTFVKLTNVVDRPKKHPEGFDRRISHVKLFLYTQEGSQIGRAELTDIKFYCRKGDQINAHINMHRKEDLKWVVGQIAPGKHSPDAHFIPDPWAEPL